jgi:hypothetical protein
MYNKQEASAVRQKFWTRFGQYMLPVPSADGGKINWINYKTGIKGISFKMNADNNRAYVAIEISHADNEMQQKYFEIFRNFKKPFIAIAGKDWDTREHYTKEDGKDIARIWVELNNINIFRETDWPAIISFLKQHIMALDVFWSEYKPAFEGE